MTVIKGIIRDREPVVTATIDSEDNLVLSPNGEYEFVIDTGFTGDIAIPHELIPR